MLDLLQVEVGDSRDQGNTSKVQVILAPLFVLLRGLKYVPGIN